MSGSLMPVLAQDGRQRFDAQRRKPHHLDARVARLRAAQILRQQPVEILVVDPNEEYFHKQEPFLARQAGKSTIGDDDTKTTEVGLPKNLSRAGHRAMAIGFNCVLRFPQPKQAQPGVQPVPPVLDGDKCNKKSPASLRFPT
jgi:hypothetical protein